MNTIQVGTGREREGKGGTDEVGINGFEVRAALDDGSGGNWNRKEAIGSLKEGFCLIDYVKMDDDQLAAFGITLSPREYFGWRPRHQQGLDRLLPPCDARPVCRHYRSGVAATMARSGTAKWGSRGWSGFWPRTRHSSGRGASGWMPEAPSAARSSVHA